MEFNEKLQKLRTNENLTQEELDGNPEGDTRALIL